MSDIKTLMPGDAEYDKIDTVRKAIDAAMVAADCTIETAIEALCVCVANGIVQAHEKHGIAPGEAFHNVGQMVMANVALYFNPPEGSLPN